VSSHDLCARAPHALSGGLQHLHSGRQDHAPGREGDTRGREHGRRRPGAAPIA